MFRQLQARADDLAESVLISALEMRRSRSLASRMKAFEDFESVVDRIDALRLDAEMLHAVEKVMLLDDLDRKVANVRRSASYRIADWFASAETELSWLLGPEAVGAV